MAMSRIRQRVWSTQSDARNSSADENVRAAKPNSPRRSGSDSRTDSSSSTTDTSGRSTTRLSWHNSMTQECASRGRVSIRLWYRFCRRDQLRIVTAIKVSCSIRHRRCVSSGSIVARQTLWSAGDRKRKCNARTLIWCRPQTAMMTFDNRTADRQPDSHTFSLRRVEGSEKLIRSLRFEADSNVGHAEAHSIIAIWFSSNQQIPRTIIDCAHGVRSIAKQVQNDLLELNAIAGDPWEAVGKFLEHDDTISLKFAQRQREHLSRSFIQVHRFDRGVLFAVE